MKRVRLNLIWKLGLAYLGLLLGVLLAMDAAAYRALRHEYERSARNQLASLSRIAQARLSQIPAVSRIADASASSVPANVADELRGLVRSLSAGGVQVSIISATGSVLADSEDRSKATEADAHRTEIREAMTHGEGSAIRRNATDREEWFYYAKSFVPAEHSSTPPIVLLFAVPLSHADIELSTLRRRVWGASVLILLLAGGMSLLVSRSFSERVERLKEFSRRVADNDFRPLAPRHKGDALDELAFALNETAARLNLTIRSLTEERNLSAAILGSMVEGVAVVSADERLVFANQAFSQAMGVEGGGRQGRLVEVVRQTELVTAIRQVLAGASTVHCEVAMGTVRTRNFAATASAVHSSGAAAVLVLYDISELRRLERVRRDFVANVSHEFKTPLTAIQGFAETLLGGAVEDIGNRQHFLEIILNHARRLTRLTNDLLKLSQIEADQMELEFSSIPVCGLIAGCVETARFRAGEKQLTLKIDCPEGIPHGLGDSSAISEVLQNLLDNAIQYTPSGRETIVRARYKTGKIIVTVSDTGIGIPQAEQARIFERFYRVDGARSREAGGTGLGLAIAKHIVEAHGGRIWVESEVGRGSDFHFSIPAVQPVNIATSDLPASEHHPSETK